MKIPSSSLRRQRGIGFVMLIFIFAVCAFVLLMGMKLFPVYSQYFAVRGVISAMANSEEVKTGTVSDIRKSFDRRASIAYIDIINGDDLEITKENGETLVTATWQAKVPLFTGYTLMVDLSTDSLTN